MQIKNRRAHFHDRVHYLHNKDSVGIFMEIAVLFLSMQYFSNSHCASKNMQIQFAGLALRRKNSDQEVAAAFSLPTKGIFRDSQVESGEWLDGDGGARIIT